MRDNPRPFEVYRHFKGKMYQILTLATDSEDGSVCVVYQALYGDYKVYVRKLDMFMSETDKKKYPDCEQQYRFEKVNPQEQAESNVKVNPQEQEENNVKVKSSEEPQACQELDAGVLEYLEAETVDARLNILASLHHRITDDMINTMAVVTDVEINEGPVEQRYQELKNCLLMKQKFEKQRY